MKNYIKIVFILLCFIIPLNAAVSQIQFFDSVKNVVTSQTYDYKNPVFSKNDGQYGFSNHCWIAYERHNGNSSDIVIRKALYSSYDSEIIFSNGSNALNINPTLINNMIVWQSNERGNWDLYYSVFSGNSWSAPALMDSSALNETDPYIRNNNNTAPSYTYLAYKRDNSIRFKRYKTSSGVWEKDTIVSDGVNENISPVICKSEISNQFGVVFLRKISDETTRLHQRLFYVYNNSDSISWENVSELYQMNSQNNLSVSFGSNEFITYSYDTLNTSHVIGYQMPFHSSGGIFTKNVPGKHLSAKGSLMGMITDNLYFYFSSLSVLSEYSDSLCFTFINRPGTYNQNPQYKKLYLGDTSLNVRFNVSTPIFNPQNYFYRIKTVWEQTFEGRTSLVESYLTDYLSGIENNLSGDLNFYLSQNYPNPFNPKTIISYQLANPNFVTLKIFDVLGNEVATLVNEKQSSGSYSVEFDGNGLASGVYFYQIHSVNFTETKSMLLLK